MEGEGWRREEGKERMTKGSREETNREIWRGRKEGGKYGEKGRREKEGSHH